MSGYTNQTPFFLGLRYLMGLIRASLEYYMGFKQQMPTLNSAPLKPFVRPCYKLGYLEMVLPVESL